MNNSACKNLKHYLGLAFLSLFFISCSFRKEKIASNQLNLVPFKHQVGALNLPDHIAPINAPFQMPQLKKFSFPALSANIIANGAKEGSKVTRQIQQTIDAPVICLLTIASAIFLIIPMRTLISSVPPISK
ncbi:hypothetical protein FBD94_21000 [Pedobacter hiemivivus]|uniref:Lipoprotein n=1 Tax=Pedobacter hiemivivus TaxID=2530454 RepID=A0A4U1G419_9SPHI|nr:hypothetical protein [Pedobacter hiemivivus]TKC57113.1 hypothetical protein FBD94_21000 [Pedobacter hiemivivus]